MAGGIIGIWDGVSGAASQLPELLNWVKWGSLIGVVVVGGAVLMVAYGMASGRTNIRVV